MECSLLSEKIDTGAKGIWKFHNFFENEILPSNRLSLGEGCTALQVIELPGKKIWLKREDANPNGSHKDRSLAYQISRASNRGSKELVISSSGNAAISAAAFCRQARIKLWVFLSPDVNRQKFLQVRKFKPQIIISRRAIRLANYLASRKKLHNLRPSTDDDSVTGFKSLGLEIFSDWEKPLPVFTYVTSGSSLLGIFEAFTDLQELGCLNKILPLNEVSSVPDGLAGRGGTGRTRRRQTIKEVLDRTGGSKYVMTENEMKLAADMLREREIVTSPEGQATVAAALKSDYDEMVCVLSGRSYSEERLQPGDLGGVARAETLSDIDDILQQ
ncbi:PLP-dependent lyase/thiolase [Patescibacteria group bacterium]